MSTYTKIRIPSLLKEDLCNKHSVDSNPLNRNFLSLNWRNAHVGMEMLQKGQVTHSLHCLWIHEFLVLKPVLQQIYVLQREIKGEERTELTKPGRTSSVWGLRGAWLYRGSGQDISDLLRAPRSEEKPLPAASSSNEDHSFKPRAALKPSPANHKEADRFPPPHFFPQLTL